MIRIGVLCPSEIAFRRFMPALGQMGDKISFVGVAHAAAEEWFGPERACRDEAVLTAEREKAERFAEEYGGRVFDSYEALMSCDEIDAVYLPLPPALHFKWGMKVLEHGKHLLCEKPCTTHPADTDALLQEAEKRGLAVHETYMFGYHSQLAHIAQLVEEGELGELRLVRIAFGFPFRGGNDFRYNKALGGGALLDCGGYTLKLASMLLGKSARVVTSQLNCKEGIGVDLFGSATLVNEEGGVAQVSFGMDNSYKCELELWGSTATLYTDRILTAPAGFRPTVTLKNNDGVRTITLPADDTFKKSIADFLSCIRSEDKRRDRYQEIRRQAALVDAVMKGSCK